MRAIRSRFERLDVNDLGRTLKHDELRLVVGDSLEAVVVDSQPDQTIALDIVVVFVAAITDVGERGVMELEYHLSWSRGRASLYVDQAP